MEGMNFIIQTKRLSLRPFTPEDAPVLHLISNEPYVLRWMPYWEAERADADG